MTRKARRKAKQQQKVRLAASAEQASADLQRSDVVTVAWMLTALATLVAELVGLLAAAVIWATSSRESGPVLLRSAPGTFLFAAAVLGTVCLVLTLLAHRLRSEPPPRPITQCALAIALAPWCLIAVLWIASGLF